ncbi:MAG: methyltransferase domain-containing protein [Desulfococcaceae bacterium]|jgi:SAM-dependent methyltransferase|nr:methyltransferase domain-containing protein [Desulfococcaceae bacterium]
MKGKANMAEEDRKRWNQKYLERDIRLKPSATVKKFYNLAPRGRALDLACGRGRNAVFLAEQGFATDAVDVSDTAIAHLSGKHPRVHPVRGDLDFYEIPENTYDLIINIRYLNRRLFPYIKEGLKSGGLLIFESFLEFDPGHEKEKSFSVSCRDYLLRSNELLHAFLSLRILCYEEKDAESDRGPARIATLIGRKNYV